MSHRSRTTPRPALQALTGLRFVAALAVVLFHVLPELTPSADGPLERLGRFGYLGVSLFFVLSGFILTYTYLDHRTGGLRVTRRAFWWARVARIYPVYFLGLVLAFPFFVVYRIDDPSASTINQNIATGVLSPLVLQAWWPTTACRWNCPAWSLSVEALFYALFPLLVVWMARRDARAVAAALTLWAAGLALAIAYLYLTPDGLRHPMAADHGFWLEMLKFNPLVHLGEFATGVAAGLLFLRANRSTRLVTTIGWLATAGVTGVAWLLLETDGPPFVLLHTGLFAPLWALVIVALALGGGVVGRVLASRIMTRLGEASYALFLVHTSVLGWFVIAVLRLYPDVVFLEANGQRALLAVYLGVAIGISLAVFRWLEEPARRGIRAWALTRDLANGARLGTMPSNPDRATAWAPGHAS
jgi:peptidoglycan/LPS O-acetylase OafA/YrhL